MEEEIISYNSTNQGIKILADDTDELLIVKVFSRKRGRLREGTVEIKPVMERVDDKYTFNLSFDLDYTCIVLCAAKALAGPVLDCFSKHKGNWNDFIKCLKDKGLDIVTDAIECVADCT